ncbi:hypothetical protein [Microtetraspora glauca]|uniref:Uncharacterized protein n=1 Tax=Microtetraspora glauca TaxID=1996 RepID=A0ABV3GJ93_MICGL
MNDTEQAPAPETTEITPLRWQCCHCGGGGLDSYGDTCRHCDGLGFC